MLRSTSLRGRVLRFVVENDGEVDARRIARHLCPPPRFVPPASRADYLAARDAHLALGREHLRTSTRKVRRALAWLHAKGLIEACAGAPEIATWFRERAAVRGVLAALHRTHPAFPSDVVGLGLHAALVEKCTQGPTRVAGVIGDAPSGATKRAWHDLVAWGVVLHPRGRRATDAGVALVAEWRAKGAA